MVLPIAAAILISSALAAGASGAGQAVAHNKAKKQGRKERAAQEKASKIRSKETKRETKAGLLEEAQKRVADEEAQRLASSEKLTKGKAKSSQNTADLVREAFKI